MATKDKKQEQGQPERLIHPQEAELAAHHLKMYHNIKADKQLHKAAKEHLKNEHENLSKVLGKKNKTKGKK